MDKVFTNNTEYGKINIMVNINNKMINLISSFISIIIVILILFFINCNLILKSPNPHNEENIIREEIIYKPEIYISKIDLNVEVRQVEYAEINELMNNAVNDDYMYECEGKFAYKNFNEQLNKLMYGDTIEYRHGNQIDKYQIISNTIINKQEIQEINIYENELKLITNITDLPEKFRCVNARKIIDICRIQGYNKYINY